MGATRVVFHDTLFLWRSAFFWFPALHRAWHLPDGCRVTP
jgi:hypothetical protein